MKNEILLKTAAALLLSVPLIASAAVEPAGEKTQTAEAAAKPEEKAAEFKNPDAKLLAFVSENSSALLSASLAGNSAFLSDFDARLTETITKLGAKTEIEALHKNPFGTVVKIKKFTSGEDEVDADTKALVYKKEIAPGTVETIELYPTGMIISDEGENIVIYAPDSLTAYKACCASLSAQLQQSVYIRQLQQAAANAAQAAEAARQEAEAARQTALRMQQETAIAKQQAAQAQQEAVLAQQQALYDDDDDWNNGWYGNGGWYGGGIVIYNPICPPFPPTPPPPPPTPPDPPTPPTPPDPPKPPPKPTPRPDNWNQRVIKSTKTAPSGPNTGSTPAASQMYPQLGRH
ncbi:MAG: hypothetical protein PHI85_09685 [Victivallaceae bacterium]|nr:hypothetical protein [Victivallaceae bacterium]